MAEDRRTILKVITGAAGAAAAAVVVGPAAAALLTPGAKDTVKGASGFVPIADLSSIPEDGTPIRAAVVVPEPRDAWAKLPPTQVGAVYLKRTGKEEVTAWSTVCPHLGCGIDWKDDQKHFACPCHDSAFDPEGKVSGGPSPRPMDALETRVAGGKVEVRFQRFELGKAKKVPI